MRVNSALLLVASAVVLAGCNGPKETCEGSFHSYYNTLTSHSWETQYNLLLPESKRKVKSVDRYAEVMEDQWLGSKGFSLKLNNIVETKDSCVANGGMSWTIKIRGALPEEIEDQYFSFLFKRGKDGLWYIELPGNEKVSSF